MAREHCIVHVCRSADRTLRRPLRAQKETFRRFNTLEVQIPTPRAARSIMSTMWVAKSRKYTRRPSQGKLGILCHVICDSTGNNPRRSTTLLTFQRVVKTPVLGRLPYAHLLATPECRRGPSPCPRTLTPLDRKPLGRPKRRERNR